MREILIALLSAAITVLITNIINYFILIKKETRLQTIDYKKDILTKVYAPILKVMTYNIVPGDGYEGINGGQIDKIKEIIDGNLELVDVELENRVWFLLETSMHIDRDMASYDVDRELIDHVLRGYNSLRKELGLPFDKNYTRGLNTFFRNIKIKLKEKRRERKIDKMLAGK